MPRDSWAQDQTRLIREARRGAGLSQAELARRLRVDDAVVAEVESGSLIVDQESRERILITCGVSAEWVQGVLRDRTRLVPLEEREAQWQAGLAAARARVEADEPSPEVSSLAYLADCLHSLRRPAEAMPVLERAIAMADEVEGEDRCELHLSLALVFQDLGDLDRATDEAELALALAEVEHPEQTPRRARHLLVYARILRDRGQLGAAQTAARQSLELDEIAWSGKRSPHRNLDRDAILNGPHSP